MAESEDRKKRKEEGRLQKRQRIDESGGVRPRKNEEGDGSKESSAPKQRFEGDNAASSARNTTTSMDRRPRPKQFTSSGHRFGRVMEIVPCRNKPRYSTLSIALPGSVLSNCQTRELRTLLVGQIARAATIYHVDEIIVFDDKLAKNENRDNGGWRRPRDRDDKRAREARYEKEKAEKEKAEEEKTEEKKAEEKKVEENSNAEGGEPQERPRVPRSDPQTFMARLLQYCECPQYLRRHFFPMHQDLHFAGLLAPVDAPHHVRAEDRSKYREGVVLEKKSPRPDGGSLVNCGIRNRPVEYVQVEKVYVHGNVYGLLIYLFLFCFIESTESLLLVFAVLSNWTRRITEGRGRSKVSWCLHRLHEKTMVHSGAIRLVWQLPSKKCLMDVHMKGGTT